MGGWGGVVQSHFIVKPNLVLRLGRGFDNKYFDIHLNVKLYQGSWDNHFINIVKVVHSKMLYFVLKSIEKYS